MLADATRNAEALVDLRAGVAGSGARHGQIRPARTCWGDLGPLMVIHIDSTPINSYSDAKCSARNFKGGYGFRPFTKGPDNTGPPPTSNCWPSNAAGNRQIRNLVCLRSSEVGPIRRLRSGGHPE